MAVFWVRCTVALGAPGSGVKGQGAELQKRALILALADQGDPDSHLQQLQCKIPQSVRISTYHRAIPVF